ncbi:MAG: TIGR04219 family outer membrane beta-barrel protein [Campylobacterota bacterium]|nr:TIGR04219 family outer membrane beta-barrel protein [Campylobacterota bacterium]
MKKTLLLSLVFSSLLQADFIRAEMGAGVWMPSSTGSINKQDLVDDLDVDSSQDYYLWALLKHPIPIIPNARIEYVKTLAEGSGNEVGIQQVDLIAYYNIFDNLAWITLDLGVDINVMEQSYKLDGNLRTNSALIPMLYGRGRFEVPGTNFGLESVIKYLSYGESNVGDIRLKVDYTLDLPLLQPAVELGYRHEVIKTSEKDFSDLDKDTDITMSGIYLGAMLRF